LARGGGSGDAALPRGGISPAQRSDAAGWGAVARPSRSAPRSPAPGASPLPAPRPQGGDAAAALGSQARGFLFTPRTPQRGLRGEAPAVRLRAAASPCPCPHVRLLAPSASPATPGSAGLPGRSWQWLSAACTHGTAWHGMARHSVAQPPRQQAGSLGWAPAAVQTPAQQPLPLPLRWDSARAWCGAARWAALGHSAGQAAAWGSGRLDAGLPSWKFPCSSPARRAAAGDALAAHPAPSPPGPRGAATLAAADHPVSPRGSGPAGRAARGCSLCGGCWLPARWAPLSRAAHGQHPRMRPLSLQRQLGEGERTALVTGASTWDFLPN